MLLGVHQSFDGLESLVPDAQSIGAATFQFFIRNNRNLQSRTFTTADFDYFNQQLLLSDINTYILHASYAINPASCESTKYKKVEEILLSDFSKLYRMSGIKNYVLHPGAYTEYSPVSAMDTLIDMMHKVYPHTYGTNICLEVMGGMGTQLMSDLESVKYVLDGVSDLPNVKLCIDTCHLFVAGIRFEDMLNFLAKCPERLGCVHVNGTLQYFGSNKDRHSSINDSLINKASLIDFIKELDTLRVGIPFVLETPSEILLKDFYDLKSILGC